ncbi:MAG: immunity 53 family protein [Phycisphaera sp.]|nr:MAG: immunity 53 family protein [Phycisphaera sp.]
MPDMHEEIPILSKLMRWYYSNCDEEWEHSCGVKIDTLDNPGWWVKVSLEGTSIDPKSIEPRKIYRDEHDWFECEVLNDPNMGGLGRHHMNLCFSGMGGPHNLSEIIEYFLRHVGV